MKNNPNLDGSPYKIITYSSWLVVWLPHQRIHCPKTRCPPRRISRDDFRKIRCCKKMVKMMRAGDADGGGGCSWLVVANHDNDGDDGNDHDED